MQGSGILAEQGARGQILVGKRMMPRCSAKRRFDGRVETHPPPSFQGRFAKQAIIFLPTQDQLGTQHVLFGGWSDL